MSLESLMNAMPFAQHLGIEIVEAADGHARGELALRDEHSSVPGRRVAHGGVIHALADTVGGAAVISLNHQPTPTVDIRFDHLAPARRDLVATADVVRDGGSVSVVEIDVHDATDAHVATARGVYKVSDPDGDTAWGDGDPDAFDDD
jgi:uncharacterized protein (TIGR00369 family)